MQNSKKSRGVSKKKINHKNVDLDSLEIFYLSWQSNPREWLLGMIVCLSDRDLLLSSLHKFFTQILPYPWQNISRWTFPIKGSLTLTSNIDVGEGRLWEDAVIKVFILHLHLQWVLTYISVPEVELIITFSLFLSTWFPVLNI